jgi:minor extracellular serine protease Vpr
MSLKVQDDFGARQPSISHLRSIAVAFRAVRTWSNVLFRGGRMRRLGGLFVTLLLLLAGCGGFESDPQLERQESFQQGPAEVGKTDYTEDPVQFTQTEYAIVTLTSPPAATYQGGINGLRPTKPGPGESFDEDSPAVQAYLRHLEDEHADYRDFLRRESPGSEIVEEYFVTLNGFAVRLAGGATPETLARGPHARAAAYSALYRPTMNVSTGLVGADEFWAATGSRGAGVQVAIIDTGVDDEHDFFRCKSIPEPKVYASGAAFDPANVLFFDHGTHVAGTVAGCADTSGPAGMVLSGVAPEAELFDYNVFPGFGAGFVAFGGSALSHDIVAAIEDVVLDGRDVINMSLGGSVEGPHDFLAEASNAAVDANVVVVASAGNSGPNQFTVGSPGSAEKVLAVGATTNAHALVLPVRVDFDGDRQEEYHAARGDFDPFAATPAVDQPLVLASDFGDELACSELNTLPEGSVVLILRGECTFSLKIANAATAGAFGAIVYNNIPGEGPIAMAGEGTIPAVGLSFEDGSEVADLHVDATTVSIDGNTLEEIQLTPDLLANFSSRGPSPFTGVIKPEVAAPGVNVVSSVFGGDFAAFNGTSMASPHVAGAAALLLSLDSGLSAEQVKAALVNSAAPIVDPDTGADYLVHEVGNGRLDLAAAFELGFTVNPPTASFGFHNLGGQSRTDRVELTVTALDGSASCSAASDGADVTVPSGGFTASPTAGFEAVLSNADSRSGDAEGYLTVTCDGQQVRVPWGTYLDSNVPF